EGEWSVAEVLHHLFKVETWLAQEIETGLERPPERLSMLRNIFKPPIWISGMRTIKVKAPKRAEPLNPPPRTTILETYNGVRARMKELALKNGKERLEQLVTTHPILGKYNGAHVVEFAYYHELRHSKQIKEILKKIGRS